MKIGKVAVDGWYVLFIALLEFVCRESNYFLILNKTVFLKIFCCRYFVLILSIVLDICIIFSPSILFLIFKVQAS